MTGLNDPTAVNQGTMKETKIVEMVLFELNEGVSQAEGKKAMQALSSFVTKSPGFLGRKTSIGEDGQFLDLVYWTDLASAKTASEKVMQDESMIPHFAVIKQESMIFKHFEVFINE